MKPSERINRIFADLKNKNRKRKLIEEKELFIQSILNYLDEEYDKNKPCEHKSSYQVEGFNDVYYNVCNDCGVLFLASGK